MFSCLATRSWSTDQRGGEQSTNTEALELRDTLSLLQQRQQAVGGGRSRLASARLVQTPARRVQSTARRVEWSAERLQATEGCVQSARGGGGAQSAVSHPRLQGRQPAVAGGAQSPDGPADAQPIVSKAARLFNTRPKVMLRWAHRPTRFIVVI